MAESSEEAATLTRESVSRREVLSSTAMACGVVASYGTLIVMAGRYLYPTGEQPKIWMFVAPLDDVPSGASLHFVDPSGAKIVIARQRDRGDETDFIALSSVCPHLGCQVHWQAAEGHFFCPCHNGAFDAEGHATEGPPAAAGQSLARYPLKVEHSLLFIEVPAGGMKSSREA